MMSELIPEHSRSMTSATWWELLGTSLVVKPRSGAHKVTAPLSVLKIIVGVAFFHLPDSLQMFSGGEVGVPPYPSG